MNKPRELTLFELDELYSNCERIIECVEGCNESMSLSSIMQQIDELSHKFYTKPIGKWYRVSIDYSHSWTGNNEKKQYEGTDKLKAEKAWNKKISDKTTRKQYRIWEYQPGTAYTHRVAGKQPKILHDEIVECKHGSIV